MEPTEKQRIRKIAFEISIIIFILAGAATATHIYNKTEGTACESNLECTFHCPAGAFNDNFIDIYRFFKGESRCSEGLTSICEMGRCVTYDVFGASQMEDCEKIEVGYSEFLCYQTLAEKKAETAICRDIDFETNKSICYFEFSKILGDLRMCSKIIDETLRDACINRLIEPPSDYRTEKPFSGDCKSRPGYSICLGFSDGYILLVFEEVFEIERDILEGQLVEVARGKKSDYYHILYTDYIKEVEKG